MNKDHLSRRPNLTTRSLHPENQETPIHFLNSFLSVPTALFYRRNHFEYPSNTSEAFSLKISGLVDRAFKVGYFDLLQMPSTMVSTFLECSGNKRAFFKEKVFGEQWDNGAMSQGVWKGVSLASLLAYCGIKEDAREIIFRGSDYGEKNKKYVYFERSLPISKALESDVIIAYEYNGKPLNRKHGFPFRLIVPGWYGMASVKWLTDIIVIQDRFSGIFQTEDYVYYYKDGSSEPVTENRVNSTILQPIDKQILPEGTHHIMGIAWTGSGVITKVELSFDSGKSWTMARLLGVPKEYQTVQWYFPIEVISGEEYMITVRATDSSGKTQPYEGIWNRKGYGYNGSMGITIKGE
jgi:DMSO/TMAO reductase YedYZ molybdopterin-dependent catalytic subunit